MAEFRERARHLVVPSAAQSEPFTSTNSFPRRRIPTRVRADHAAQLLAQLGQVERAALADQMDGCLLEFESAPGFDLMFSSLDLQPQGIQLLNVRQEGNITFATVYVPRDKLAVFISRVEKYRDELTNSAAPKPKNSPLVNSISNIRRAMVRSLWTDTTDSFPQAGEQIWWEVWLRNYSEAEPEFREIARTNGISVSERSIRFVDRVVLLALGNQQSIENLIARAPLVAELRRAKETAAHFVDLQTREQARWTEVLQGLVQWPAADAPAVCILDTGINHEHPLITQAIHPDHLLTCVAAWGSHDHHGHGTQMAGLALFGDLVDALQGTERINLEHRLESVKILPPPPDTNRPELYGEITAQAVSRMEIQTGRANRAICMAVATTDFRDQGKPSSWSAAVDNLCYGDHPTSGRLLILSAGNNSALIPYPDGNLTEGIHDPAQSWNALTVGAFTEKNLISETELAGWQPIARPGQISPYSATSLTFERKWPLKPDVVFEGGNAAVQAGQVDHPGSLSLLTTHFMPHIRQYGLMRATSAATALAGRFAGSLMARYPEFWPETVRALMIHSARWTPAMLEQFPSANRTSTMNRLRCYGYGVPNLERALWSASNNLTLIAQGQIFPFQRNKTREMHLHRLPWPKDVLRDLGETPVQMRVTLSYFVEPNPSRRGWERKFSYQSHGLRFDVKTATESVTEFRTRMNRVLWDAELGRDSVTTEGDAAEWELGSQLRSAGSVHSDIWQGTAAALAEREYIGVFPVLGWWKERASLNRWQRSCRYSLLVSISTESRDIDIYTPVETQITIPIRTT